MRKFLFLLGFVAVVGAATYFVCYHRAMASVIIVTPDGTDAELAWLKREFALSNEQYAKVEALHEAYRPLCVGHCANYLEAHGRLKQLLETRTSWSPEIGEAVAAVARIQSECHASMLEYAYDVAACMSPEQGRRYLEMIKMQIIEGDPAGMFASAR